MKKFYIILICLSLSCTNSKSIKLESPEKNELKSGENFAIELPENHTTGYLWQLENSYDGKHIDYINAVWHGNDKGIYFNFQALEKGETTLKFSLIKHTDTLERKTFILNIK